jgi:hypothetical protein
MGGHSWHYSGAQLGQKFDAFCDFMANMNLGEMRRERTFPWRVFKMWQKRVEMLH